jgi:hypothetical protein
MHHLKSGTKKGNTIIGRFETIKKLEEITNRQLPAKYIAEIDLIVTTMKYRPWIRAKAILRLLN